MSHVITIAFEVEDETTADQLHELLCLAIHEGDAEALGDLAEQVENVAIAPAA